MAEHNGPVRNERKRHRRGPLDDKPVPMSKAVAQREYKRLAAKLLKVRESLVKAEVKVIEKERAMDEIQDQLAKLQAEHGFASVPLARRPQQRPARGRSGGDFKIQFDGYLGSPKPDFYESFTPGIIYSPLVHQPEAEYTDAGVEMMSVPRYSPSSPRYAPQPVPFSEYGSHSDNAPQSRVPVIDLCDDDEAESEPAAAQKSVPMETSNSNSNSNSSVSSSHPKSQPPEECPVCLEVMQEQNCGVFPSCERHKFCCTCLPKLDINKGCPVCRSTISV